MNQQQPLIDLGIEPERYEFFEDLDLLARMSRRTFFRLVGAGLVVAVLVPEELAAQRRGGRGGFGGRLPRELGAWLHIGPDSRVTVYTGKVELGQNIRTSLSQAVAEELHTPIGRIHLVMADTALTPFDMGTFGSLTTTMMAAQLRRVAAAARELLLDLAAQRGKIERGTLAVAGGKVVERDGQKSFEFGELTRGKKLVKVVGPDEPITPARDWKVTGTPAGKVDGWAFVTGAHRYASDMKRPGMRFGKVLRPPSFGAKLESVDTRAARAVPDATVVHDGDFVGAVALTEQAAANALAALQVRWKTVAQPSGDELFTYLKEHPAQGRGRFGMGRYALGSVADGMKAADRKLEARYTVAYIAHVPLETRAAVAEWSGDKLTIWTGTQRPFGVRTELAQALGVAAERVRVIVPDTGSGYGGKHTGEAAVEAARLARAVHRPVTGRRPGSRHRGRNGERQLCRHLRGGGGRPGQRPSQGGAAGDRFRVRCRG